MTATTIEIRIDGKIQVASISEILHPVHRMFFAIMEDSYSNIFFTDVETGEWIEQDLGFTRLAEAVKLDTDLWQLFRISGIFEWNYNQESAEDIAFCIDNYSITHNEN